MHTIMKYFINTSVLLFLTISIVYIQAGPIDSNPELNDGDQCGINEQYMQCGTACPETCDYKPEMCMDVCKSGCFCKDGYVRQSNDPNSPCILKQLCATNTTTTTTPINCDGQNQEYNLCGSACPPSCSDIYNPETNKACTLQCIIGCSCKQGYYLTKNSTCVKPEECCQGENEQYKIYGSSCPETCDHEYRRCTKPFVQGCFCKLGYIRKDNSTNSPCIERDQC